MSQGSHERSLTNYGPKSLSSATVFYPTCHPLTPVSRHTFAALGVVPAVLASPAAQAADPCAKIAGKTFAPPQDALARMKSFPFNE